MPDGRFTIALTDGRRLECWASDGNEPSALLLQVGTPGAGVPYEPMLAGAARHGLRFVTYSRPGYASSTRRPGRSVADCAPDVAAIADRLGVERLHAVGWSGGGPHALACAALLPELVRSAATLAGVAPWDVDGLDWLDGMAEENRDEFGAALDGAAALKRFLGRAAENVRKLDGEAVADALGGLATDVDRRALSGSLADYLALLLREGVSTGISGWLDDDLAFVRDWAFALDTITVPVAVWQGRQDAMVPYGHGEWLAGHVPGARAMILEDEGHISLVGRFGDIVDDLVDAAS